ELASPSLAEALDRCVAAGAREVWVHPFFLVPGRHLSTDIPAQLAAEAERHPGVSVQLTSALGMTAGIADLVLSTVPLAQG
ncbi:MAG: cobalamin biosynthesis protein CbiX, partial [Myxococcales bacterium]|nr:cobalamin biosynthesis protein CbiX [Myxococcales bacterium]